MTELGIMTPPGLSQRSRAAMTGTSIPSSMPKPPSHSETITSTRSGRSISMTSPCITCTTPATPFAATSSPAKASDRRALHRVHALRAGPRREHAQDAASRADVEHDVAGLHHGVDRALKGLGAHPIANHRAVHLELRVHRVERASDRCPHLRIVRPSSCSHRRTARDEMCRFRIETPSPVVQSGQQCCGEGADKREDFHGDEATDTTPGARCGSGDCPPRNKETVRAAGAAQAPAEEYQEPEPAQNAPPPADPADQIEHLAQLHASGALTDEEFAAAKAQGARILSERFGREQIAPIDCDRSRGLHE